MRSSADTPAENFLTNTEKNKDRGCCKIESSCHSEPHRGEESSCGGQTAREDPTLTLRMTKLGPVAWFCNRPFCYAAGE